MAAGTWKLFNKAKKKLATGVVSLGATTWRMALVKTIPAATLSLLGSATQVGNGNGYTTNGKACTSELITVSSGGAATYKFDVDDVVWTATGGNITSIKGAIVVASGASALARHVLAYVSLTSTQFQLNQNSTLTVTLDPVGVFTMV